MKQQMKHIALFAIPHALVLIVCFIMILSGQAIPFIEGFAVDSQGLMYVGEWDSICIYQDSTPVGVIPFKSATYAFTIDNKEELSVAFPSVVYRMSTTGAVLEKQDDPAAETYQQLRRQTVVTTSNGDRYQKVSEFGWTRILKNGTEVVYKITPVSFIVKILLFLCTISMFVNGAWMILRFTKQTQVLPGNGSANLSHSIFAAAQAANGGADGTIYRYPCSCFYLKKQHPCPKCATVLERKQREKVVHSQSEEAKNYDFSCGDTYLYGNIKFVTYYFACPNCEENYEILQLKALQKAQKKAKKDRQSGGT